MNMNKIINAVVAFLAVFFLFGILLNVCALAQSLNVTNIVTLVLSIFALNQCCGILLKVIKPQEQKATAAHRKELSLIHI